MSNTTKIKNIAIVDPIFKVSRLQYSHRVAQKAEELGMNIHLLVRTNSYTPLYEELFSNIEHQLYEIAELPDNFWFGKIPKPQIKALINELQHIHQKVKLDAIYFAGGHELFPECVDIMIQNSYQNLRNIPIIMIEYVPNFLLTMPYKKTNQLQKFFMRKKKSKATPISQMDWYELLFSYYKKLHVAILDERILGKKIHKKFFYLPDPCPTLLPETYITESSEKKIKILIVGLQSDRKGLDEIINLEKEFGSALDHISFIFTGRLSEETEIFREDIINSKMIEWHEGFFSEEEMRIFYANCDYVILPYSTLFDGSSGVMAYATAFHKPLITTEHGCIGFRNQYFQMGYTYKFGDIKALNKILQSLPDKETNKYHQLCTGSKQFSIEHSEVKHIKMIFSKLGIR